MSYSGTKKKYSALGIGTGAAVHVLKSVHVSLHCWQGDAIFDGTDGADRNKLDPKYFAKLMKLYKDRGHGCNFNPTFFSQPKCDLSTLSSTNGDTRKFWIEHGKACIGSRAVTACCRVEGFAGQGRVLRSDGSSGIGDVWDQYCGVCGKPLDRELFGQVQKYEAYVLSRRG